VICRLLVLFAAAVLCGPLLAAQPMTLRYGGDKDFAPFESLDSNGQASGFQIDLLQELARVGDFELTIQLDDWPAVEEGLRSGRFDAIGMVNVPSRHGWALFARSHATPALAIYQPAGQLPLQSLQDLAGQIVAVSDGQPMRETRTEILAGIGARFLEVRSPLEALQAVAAGQAAVAVLPQAYGDRLVGSAAVRGVVSAGFSLRLQPYAFAVVPGNEALRARIEAALAELESSGRLEALRIRWLSSHRELATVSKLSVARATDRRWFMEAAAAGLFVLVLLVWQLRLRSRRMSREAARRREAEDSLALARSRLEQSFTRHPDAMVVASIETGEVQDANPAFCELIGLDREALLGQTLRSLPAFADPSSLLALKRVLQQEGALEAFPLRVCRADGEFRSCLVSCEAMSVGTDQHVFAILRDVTEQMRSNEQLRTGYEELTHRLALMATALEAASVARANAEASAVGYTTTVAHDLKAPLRAVRGFVGLLHGNLDTGRVDQAHSNAEQIDKAAQRMEGLIAALSRLSLVSRSPLSLADTDMAAMAESTWKLLCAAHPSCAAELQVDDALPACRADPDLTLQIWQNLLDNAMKFTSKSPRPKVRVSSFGEGGRRWYRITDNGAGFDSAQASRLFQPFQRMHSSREFDGTGIGLSTVQRIVHRHGGEIRARSQVGVGTIIEFTLDPVVAG